MFFPQPQGRDTCVARKRRFVKQEAGNMNKVQLKRSLAVGSNKPVRESAKRDRIMRAAEKLFALGGYHGVSIRDIATAANVGSTLIIHHFESKEKLYKAVFALHQDLAQERLRVLEAINDFAAPDALERVVHAFVSPIVKSHATVDGRYYAQLIVREASDPQEETRGIIEEYFDPTARAFIAALQRTLPNVDYEYLCWAYCFSVGALVMSIFDRRIPRISTGIRLPISVERKTRLLALYVTEGIRGGTKDI
jgi:AcrR family transcriptional regulator